MAEHMEVYFEIIKNYSGSVWPRDFAGQKHVFKQKRKNKYVWPNDFKEIAFLKTPKPTF